MDLKGTLKAITLELRRELEGKYDAQGVWQPGDLERRLAGIGVRRDRESVPVDELPHLTPEDREARRVVDAFLQSRSEAGDNRETAIAEFVRYGAYTWANRLLALRCMEARALIDEVIQQKNTYGGRSLQHSRLVKKHPERCAGEDEGLYAVLFDEFSRRAEELPMLFDPRAPEVALRPSVAGLKRCVALLSGALPVRGQEAATDEVFTAADAFGWTYQYWNTEEKARVFEKVRTKKGAKITGTEIIPATCIYTEPYMVRFLVQNSLGAIWMGMQPDSQLSKKWEYYVHDADRAPVSKKPVADLTFLDPACGSGHFLIEAFELFYAMYVEERALTDPAQICVSVLERNLYGIDIDERAVQIAATALVMKAKEKAPDFVPRRVNLVATNIRLPADKEYLGAFLTKHPEDAPLKPALLTIFDGLARADELGSLLQIEEPVDRELRHLRDEQLARDRKAGAGSLFGYRKDEDWLWWKYEVIERLRHHFGAEAQEGDPTAAFFGVAASKGLSLVDLLARRYDVVAANPPYVGSKNMGPLLKTYVGKHFKAGKRDLAFAFNLRCLELVKPEGRVAVVAPELWLFLSSYKELRGKVLGQTTLENIAQLGRHAFSEADPPNNVALVVSSAVSPGAQHRMTCFRVSRPAVAEEQAAALRDAAAGRRTALAFRPEQRRFSVVPGAPIAYWLRPRFLELLEERTLSKDADVFQGLATANDQRFIRFVWEVRTEQWKQDVATRRWVPLEKGGGYGKWFGHHWWVVDWGNQGARIKCSEGAHVSSEAAYFRPGWTYSLMARGSMGCRRQGEPSIFGHKGPALFFRMPGFGALLNSITFGYIIRSLSPNPAFEVGTVARGPVPKDLPAEFEPLENAAVSLKTWIVSHDPTERTFARRVPRLSHSLSDAHLKTTSAIESAAAWLHAIEGVTERKAMDAFQLSSDDRASILEEMGMPVAWLPGVEGEEDLPDLPAELSASTSSARAYLQERQVEGGKERRARVLQRLLELYKRGPRSDDSEDDDEVEDDGEDDGDGPEDVSSTRKPVPTETFVEELSRTIAVHPASVVSLLKERRSEGKLICPPLLRRYVEDYLSVQVLRVLGHSWPDDIDNPTPPGFLVSTDGVLVISDSMDPLTLLPRVRSAIEADFGAKRVSVIERECGEILGKPLAAWLAKDFFIRHVAQFRKRPVVWQIESKPQNRGGQQSRSGPRKAPAFSCLLYYHCLDTDLLPKLRTQYVGQLRSSFQTELSYLEKVASRSADQDQRRLELEEKLDELKTFDARLEQVIIAGFTSAGVEKFVEPLDHWTSRDGHLRAPETQDALLAQERKYDPDPNDGIRTNIAPLQRAGLLAGDVLAAKDVEKAIADRAKWRADERRWCREGKLSQPGWWPGKNKL